MTQIKSNRRTFLKSILGVGVALPTVLATQASAIPSRGALRVGVLTPNSGVYPKLGQHFLDGLKLGTQLENAKLEFIADTFETAFGAAQKAKTWLERKSIDALVVLGDELGESLRELADAHGIPVIVNEFGARIPQRAEHSPFIFRNSLGLWQSEWALGEWVAANHGKNVLIVSTLREAGYDLGYAFASGVAAKGGRVLETVITDQNSSQHAFDTALARIRALKPDAVHFISSDPNALEFVKHYANAGFRTSRLSVSAPSLASSFLSHKTRAFIGVNSAFTWAENLPCKGNQQFVRAFKNAMHHNPDAVAVLGFESAQWLSSAFSTNFHNPQSLVRALTTAKFDSPRGTFSISSQHHFYLRNARATTHGFQHLEVQQLPSFNQHQPALNALRGSLRSGFSNIYLT